MRLVRTLAISCTALMVCSAALAQEGRPGRGTREGGARQQQRMRQLAPEKALAAWKLQATTVAHDLKVDKATAEKLTEVYVDARNKMNEAIAEWRREMREQREGGQEKGGQRERGQRERGQRGGFNADIMQEARDNLQADLAGMLDEGQTARAMASLGTFSVQWDRMVDSLASLSLEPESLHEALSATNVYIASMTKLRESGDRQAMREGMRGIREQLRDDLAEVLSEQQMEQMQASLGRGMGGQRPAADRQRQGRPARERGGDDARPDKAVATIGEPAPNFTLSDANGKSYTLADYKGRIVVLQWINPDCPICRGKASSGEVTRMAKEMKELSGDIVHLTINSTHYMEPETSAAYLKEHKINAPALSDRDGKVGKLYDAKTTPHLYVIDAEGILRYNGAIDDKKGNNYVVQAVRQIVAGDTVSPDSTRPYGCNVKYAK